MSFDATVIYHSNCADGFTAAWICRKALSFQDGLSVEYIPWQYQRGLPEIKSRVVYIVDFSFSAEELKKLYEECDMVVVLDHHKTAEKELTPLVNKYTGLHIIFNTDKCGAVLTWEYFFPGEEMPKFIDYVQDRDLWQWKLSNSNEINAYIQSVRFNFENWDRLYHTDLMLLYDKGCAILEYQEKMMDQSMKNIQWVDYRGYEDIPFVNCTVNTVSELLNRLSGQARFAVAYSITNFHRVKLSFRSHRNNPDYVDVGEFCKSLGGGGHTHAAGLAMTLTELHDILDIS